MASSGPRYFLATSMVAVAAAAAAGETTSYTYDALGRLTATATSEGVNNGVATGIAYDPAGNRSSYTVSGVGSSGSPGSPTVAGGGFEGPDQGASYVYRPTANFTNNSGLAGNGSAWGFAAAPEGDQVAFIQTIDAPAVITLPVSGLVAGTSYAVRFQIALRPGYAANPITVAFNGVTLGTFSPGSTAFTALTSAAFTAGAGTGTLTFTGSAYSGDTATGLDNVTVVPASAPPTVAGGGFETPDLGASYLYRPAGSPAAFTHNSGVAGHGSLWGFAAPPEGDQVAFIQTIDAPAVISLPISGLVPGTSYVATFQLAARTGFPSNPVTVAFNGTSLGTFSPGSTTFAVATSAPFTASGSSGTLTFTGASHAGDTSTGLDKVTLSVAP